MTKGIIKLTIDYPQLYRFGFSETDDIATVVNWQRGKREFINLTDGRKYFFAEPLYDATLPSLRFDYFVACNCKLSIQRAIRTTIYAPICVLTIDSAIRTTILIEPDWQSGVTSAEEIPDINDTDWSSGITTECTLTIASAKRTTA